MLSPLTSVLTSYTCWQNNKLSQTVYHDDEDIGDGDLVIVLPHVYEVKKVGRGVMYRVK